jgi:hypothetical protein
VTNWRARRLNWSVKHPLPGRPHTGGRGEVEGDTPAHLLVRSQVWDLNHSTSPNRTTIKPTDTANPLDHTHHPQKNSVTASKRHAASGIEPPTQRTHHNTNTQPLNAICGRGHCDNRNCSKHGGNPQVGWSLGQLRR